MQYNANIPVIQEWLGNIAMSENFNALEIENMPLCIRQLSDRACITKSGTLKLIWGGGFGHWGLEVGCAGICMPPSHTREYHLSLADGAWVWHEIQ